jgi:hypothetical protein
MILIFSIIVELVENNQLLRIEKFGENVRKDAFTGTCCETRRISVMNQ